MPVFIKTDGYFGYSFNNIRIKMKRKSLDYLLSSFYVPTGSFALLSMISFLIDSGNVSAIFLHLIHNLKRKCVSPCICIHILLCVQNYHWSITLNQKRLQNCCVYFSDDRWFQGRLRVPYLGVN